jgi:heme-degrading monooxygenase HmoA
MTQLHIYLDLIEGENEELSRRFREIFVPAIRIQPGFLDARLLKTVAEKSRYVVQLSFQTEEQRKAWVDSEEHQYAFPRIAELCNSRSAVRYDVLDTASAGG